MRRADARTHTGLEGDSSVGHDREERIPQPGVAVVTQLGTVAVLDLLVDLPDHLHHVTCRGRRNNQLGSTVGRIRPALHVPQIYELIHQLPQRSPRDARPFGEDRRASPAGIEVGEDRAVLVPDGGVAGAAQSGQKLRSGVLVRRQEQRLGERFVVTD